MMTVSNLPFLQTLIGISVRINQANMEEGERPADMNHLCQIKHRRSQTKTNGTKNKQKHPNL